ncbi:MAG: hypothetical protein H6Q16_30 [Bacteroidetes bacterium]|nr:hypothetical protein [Bacteroidota bacterium]
MISIAAITFLVGFLFYIFNKKYVLFYYLIWQLLFPYLLRLFIPFLPDDLVKQYSGFSNYFLISIFLFNIHKINYRKYQKLIIILFSISLLLLILSIYHGLNLYNYQSFIISNLLPPLIFISLLDIFKVDKINILKFFLLFFVLEIILGLTQYLFEIGIVETFNRYSVKPLLGTFTNNNIYISFILFLYLFSLFYKGKKLIKYISLKLLFALLIFILVMLSGIRTYLLLYFIFLPLIFYMSSPYKLLVVTLSLPIIAIIFSYIFSVNTVGYTTKDADNAVERQIYGASNFLSGNDEGSTLNLSTYLLEYFYNKPFFGSGLYFTNLGYGGKIASDTGNSTDVTFVLYLTEFGIFGFFLIMLFFIKLFDISLRNKKGLILYLYLLISTITDPGIFSNTNQVFLILMIYCFSKDQLRNSVVVDNSINSQLVSIHN